MTGPHYVRRFNRWVPEDPAPARTPWHVRLAAVNPVARWSLAIGVVLFLTAVIVIVSLQIGDAAADGFGPLIPTTPTTTPTPTPYPNGWTP